MTPKSTLIHLFPSRRDMLRVVVLVAAALAVMAVLTVTFGVHSSGPSYDLIPDPAAGLPF
jgi:hypothetical protein